MPDRWIDPSFDFPKRAVGEEELTYVVAELTVNPHGYVSDCHARAFYGNPNMAAYTCELLRLRAEFEPARDPSRRRMYGVYRQGVGWWKSDKKPPPSPEETARPTTFEVRLDRLPAGTEQPPIAGIQFYVDANGNGSSCTPARDSNNRELGEIACERLEGSLRVTPAKDRRGRPVPSVQTATVSASTP